MADSLEAKLAKIDEAIAQCLAAQDALEKLIVPLQEQLTAMQTQATTLAAQLELIHQRQKKYKLA